MFPVYDGNSGFTYDHLSEIGWNPFWTGLASIVTAAFAVVVVLAASGQAPVQADSSSAETAFAAPVGTDHADDMVAAP